jgi:hypothetical protein
MTNIRQQLKKITTFACLSVTTVVLGLCFGRTPAVALDIFEPTDPYKPMLMKGFAYNPENLFDMSFVYSKADEHMTHEQIHTETNALVDYFLSSLSVPKNQLWVNLSPYEPDRILPDMLSKTDMGIKLLDLDYRLKILVSSFMHPDYALGEEYWEALQEEVFDEFGETFIDTDSFNKVWIVPDKAKLRVNKSNVFIVDSHMKVMLEEDYLAATHARYESDINRPFPVAAKTDQKSQLGGIPYRLFNEIVVPALEKEINTGATFVELRQIFHSLILATWYRDHLLANLVEQAAELNGDPEQPPDQPQDGEKGGDGNAQGDQPPPDEDQQRQQAKKEIYEQYLEGYQNGVYDLIKEEYDPITNEVIQRKYASGGLKMGAVAVENSTNAPGDLEAIMSESYTQASGRLSLTNPNGLDDLFSQPNPSDALGPDETVGGIDLDTTDMDLSVSGQADNIAVSALQNIKLPMNAFKYEVTNSTDLPPDEVVARLGLREEPPDEEF